MAKTKNLKGTKETILISAAEVFLDHGYYDTTVRMIAQKAEVNQALINYHFGDKEALYLEVIRYWAREAFKDFPFNALNDASLPAEEKIRLFIFHTLLCLFGPEGKGTGFGTLLAHEAALHPSSIASEIVAETIKRPTANLEEAIKAITGIDDTEKLKVFTACIVGQTVYFYLSRHLTSDLFGIDQIRGVDDITKLSGLIYQFSIAALQRLNETV